MDPSLRAHRHGTIHDYSHECLSVSLCIRARFARHMRGTSMVCLYIFIHVSVVIYVHVQCARGGECV
jgi:hypothetical protein